MRVEDSGMGECERKRKRERERERERERGRESKGDRSHASKIKNHEPFQ